MAAWKPIGKLIREMESPSCSSLKDPCADTCLFKKPTDDIIQFKIGNEEKALCVDRSNLVSKSPVFSAMFSGAFSESNSSIISLEGSSLEAVTYFVNFIQGKGFNANANRDSTWFVLLLTPKKAVPVLFNPILTLSWKLTICSKSI